MCVQIKQMQVRIVSVAIAKKQRAVQAVRATFADAVVGGDANFVFARTTHDEGCYVNHMRYWRELLASSEMGFWIFEDDVVFVRTPLSTLHAYVERYGLSGRSVFYLGHRLSLTQAVFFERLTRDTLRVKTNDLHGYYIGREAAAAMLAPYNGVPLDVHVANHNRSLDLRAVYPMVAVQLGPNGVEELLCETLVEFGPILSHRWRRILVITLLSISLVALFGLGRSQ